MKSKKHWFLWVTTYKRPSGREINGWGFTLGHSWRACIEEVANEAMQ